MAEISARSKTGVLRVFALVLTAHLGLSAPPAIAEETVYIGGRSTGPAVEVDLSVLSGHAVPRARRPSPPDVLPLDPVNGPDARAASGLRLAPLPKVSAPVAPPAPVAAAAPPAKPSAALANLTPAPLSLGLSPAQAPVSQAQPSALTAAAPPKPITPATAAAINAPPPAASPPQAIAALPAGLSQPALPAPATVAAAAILFAPGASELSPEATAQLDAMMASLTPKDRVQLKAHASGGKDDAEVRRVSLKRALAARSHLLAGGMDSTRIDVRALGPAGDGAADDRVDVIVVAQ